MAGLSGDEAEWAVRALIFDRLGERAQGLAVEACEARPGDPPNIRRLSILGRPGALRAWSMAIDEIAAGKVQPPGIWARSKDPREADFGSDAGWGGIREAKSDATYFPA